jgi:hypothetical protein
LSLETIQGNISNQLYVQLENSLLEYLLIPTRIAWRINRRLSSGSLDGLLVSLGAWLEASGGMPDGLLVSLSESLDAC